MTNNQNNTLLMIEEKITNIERTRIKAETERDAYRRQYEERNEELKALGYNPKTAVEEIENDKREALELINKIKELLPQDEF